MTDLDFLPGPARRGVLAASLRTAWLAQLLIVVALIAALARQGDAWLPAIAIVATGWWLVQLTIMALGFVVKWLAGDWPAVTRGATGHWLRTAAVEIGWMARLYLIDQPWRPAPMQMVAADPRAPLLLVHGFFCNGAVWRPFARHLRERSFASVSLQPSYRNFQAQLDDLHLAVEAWCARSGRSRVLLVGHSMGGLLARAYAGRHPERCAGVVCVAAPHHGTLLGDLIHGVEAGPPSPRCRWLREFNARSGERIGVPALNLWTADDNIVVPAASARLAAAPERAVHGFGHMAVIAAPGACAALLQAIDDIDHSPEHYT